MTSDGTLQTVLGRYSRPSRNPVGTLARWLSLAKLGVAWGARLSTAALRTRPDFIIIGAQRCGTTSLYNYLVEHPDIAPAFVKETHFFDLYYNRGLNWYRAYFPIRRGRSSKGLLWQEPGAGQGYPLTGESTPYYLFHPRVPRRVWEAVPEVKLILLLRNPVDRAFSHYHHEVLTGAEGRTFAEAVEQEADTVARETARLQADEGYRSFAHMHHTYLARGIYVDQLKRWTEFFDQDQMLVLKSEDLFHDPHACLEEVMQFLGLPVQTRTGRKQGEYEKHNLGHYTEMDAATRQQLSAYFEPHNQRLYEYLGTDLGWDGWQLE